MEVQFFMTIHTRFERLAAVQAVEGGEDGEGKSYPSPFLRQNCGRKEDKKRASREFP
jgi:hypothetical protein